MGTLHEIHVPDPSKQLFPWSEFFWILLVSLCLVVFLLNIVGTMRAIRATEGSSTPLWIALIWLFPVVGGICALHALRPAAPGLP